LIRLLQYVFGWADVYLADVCNSISSGKAKTKENEGLYPVYGSTGIIARTDTSVYKKDNILVARVGANAGYTHIASGEYDVSDNTLIVDIKKEFCMKYVYYSLVNKNLNQYAKGGGQPLITAGQIKQITMMMPDNQEQIRVVEILDKFQNICTDIETGIPAEIVARQKQYEFYREKLLTFKENDIGGI
jgi:type I restriction enzyme S subunit